MPCIKQWAPHSWEPDVAREGEALVQIFSDLGYDDETVGGMIRAYTADAMWTLPIMTGALGLSMMTTDINYILRKDGKMALMLDIGRNKPDKFPEEIRPEQYECGRYVEYDTDLRAWVADLEIMHARMMANLWADIFDAKAKGVDATLLEEQVKEFDASEICDKGKWAHGIATKPVPKFSVVTKWIQEYYPDFFDLANKIIFFKSPDSSRPPFVVAKVHPVCIFLEAKMDQEAL